MHIENIHVNIYLYVLGLFSEKKFQKDLTELNESSYTITTKFRDLVLRMQRPKPSMVKALL